MTSPPDFTPDQIKAAIRSARTKRQSLERFHKEQAKKPPSDPTASERDAVTAKAVELLNAHPSVLFAYHQTTGKMRGATGKTYTVSIPGLPDIVGATTSGRFIGIEVKRPNERASFSPDQLAMQHRMAIAGCVTGTITEPAQAVELVEASEAHHGGRSRAWAGPETRDGGPPTLAHLGPFGEAAASCRLDGETQWEGKPLWAGPILPPPIKP